MKDFGLYVIITDPIVSHEKIAESCVKNKVAIIQLREKDIDDQFLFEIAKNLSDIVKGSNTKLIINDRLDIAIACNADGTHVGQDDMPLDSIRPIVKNQNHIFGLSTHSIEQAKAGLALHPDYIGFGPIYQTFAKKNPDPAVGVEKISEVMTFSQIPVVAIGGINRTNIDNVLSAGARNVAMISAICKSEKYDEEIQYFNDKLRQI